MRFLVIQHDDDTHLGSLAVPVAAAADIDTWQPDLQELPAREVHEYDAVISLGGVAMPDEDDRHPWIPGHLRLLRDAVHGGVPVLGICLGSQLLSRALGGVVRPADASEVGWYELEPGPAAADDPVLGGLPDGFRVFHWHHYAWEPPPGATLLATTPQANQAFRYGPAAWGIQFHIEVTQEIIEQWTYSEAGLEDMHAHGFDPDAIVARSRELVDRYVERANDLAQRFVDVARARAASGQPVG